MPWRRNRKGSERMKDFTKLKISKMRVLCHPSVEGQTWRVLLSETFDFCSHGMVTASVLKPCWVVLANEGLYLAIRTSVGGSLQVISRILLFC